MPADAAAFIAASFSLSFAAAVAASFSLIFDITLQLMMPK